MAKNTITKIIGLQEISMDIYALNNEQIEYEWSVRFPTAKFESTRKATEILAPILVSEFDQTSHVPGMNSSPFSQKVDIEHCDKTLVEVRAAYETGRLDLQGLQRQISILKHVGDRLLRIVAKEEHKEQWELAVSETELLFNEIYNDFIIKKAVKTNTGAIPKIIEAPITVKTETKPIVKPAKLLSSQLLPGPSIRDISKSEENLTGSDTNLHGSIKPKTVGRHDLRYSAIFSPSMAQIHTSPQDPDNLYEHIKLLSAELIKTKEEVETLKNRSTSHEYRGNQYTQIRQNVEQQHLISPINTSIANTRSPIPNNDFGQSLNSTGVNNSRVQVQDIHQKTINTTGFALNAEGQVLPKPLSVEKWKCKFSGRNTPKENELGLPDFLDQMNNNIRAGNYSPDAILLQVASVLTGPALDWLNYNKKQPKTWTEFEKQIKTKFLPKTYQFDTELYLQTRKQKRDESVAEYFGHMLKTYRSLPEPVSEERQCYIIQKNLLYQISNKMALEFYTDIDLMEEKARNAERNWLANAKELSNAVTTYKKFANKRNNRRPMTQVNEVDSCDDPETEDTETSESESTNETQENPELVALLDAIQQIKTVSQPKLKTKTDFSKQGRQAFSQTNSGLKPFTKTQTNRDTKSEQQAPFCLKCKGIGHKYQNCNDPTIKIFCYKCGADNVISSQCKSEYCQKQAKN